MRVLKNEMKARELVDRSDLKSMVKSTKIKSYFEKSTGNEVYFSIDSQTYPGKKHIVIISSPSITENTTLEDLKKIIKKEDIKVACSCDAFLYQGYRYLTYKAKAGIDKENRPPNKRNPRHLGMCCKHILSVLRHLGV